MGVTIHHNDQGRGDTKAAEVRKESAGHGGMERGKEERRKGREEGR